MGGFGSGFWRTFNRKIAVDDCVVLDTAWLAREQAFDRDGCPAAQMAWRDDRSPKPLASVDYQVWLDDCLIRLHHAVSGGSEQLAYNVGLTSTDLPWLGKRWWFICPLVIDGVSCQKRVGKLYLPPGGRYYGCRHCYDLTYESCRDSHRWDKLWRTPEAERGMSTRDMRDIVNHQKWIHDIEQRKRRNAQRRKRRAAMNWK